MTHEGKHDLLRIEDLRIAFQMQDHLNEVVKGVSLRVPMGKTVALVGESGSGKTVISQAVMGLLSRKGIITGGRILFRDPKQPDKEIDLTQIPRDGRVYQSLRGGRMGMIFQEPMSSLSPVHSIGNQVEEALTLHHGVRGKAAREATERMFSLVGFRDAAWAYDRYPFELSGGLRQRAMLAMALICRPALLIADEPTTALDMTIQAQVLKLMKQLQQEFGMAILLITHDLGVVANLADEVFVIYQGEILEMGEVDDIFRRPQHPYLKALLKASPSFDMAPGERLVTLREVPALPPSRKLREVPRDQPILEVRDLNKTYRQSGTLSLFGRGGSAVRAVDNVSFDIRAGECFGLVGESGSGKTTVGHLIMRSRAADSGQIMFHGPTGPIDVLGLDSGELRRFRPNVQMIFQDPVSSLSPRMTVLDILREPMIIQGDLGPEQQRNRAAELMQLVGLDPRFLNRYPHSFSGGQRQRIGIARALALEPQVIICDEPVSALDVSVQAQVLNLLKDLQQSLGLTYLFVSHNLAVVHYMASRIAVMARGRIVELATRDQLFRAPRHPYTQALLAAVPYADLDRPLDLQALELTSASDPSRWPGHFSGPGLEMVEVEAGHRVLMRIEGIGAKGEAA
ncbi:ABC transporter ATP-binding protein [Rhabdaerophilum sp. SD176]|uniref:ABC transporter ATP-binding protein n=1 Tax=Rhabdaerophilum sp. SD176 TaxID=2983548 RepID=UPI0024DF3ED9|nr:ABC transporter ATP-binding protein [Rhabdaerophilum sp. SD176]